MQAMKVEIRPEAKGGNKKRFSAQEKLLVLSEVGNPDAVEAVAEKYRLAVTTVKRWQAKQAKSKSKDDPLGLGGLGDQSTRPKRFGHCLPAATAERVLKLWQENPGMGPSQVKYQLKREGLNVSTKAVRRVLVEHGYQRKGKCSVAGGLQRFEAERPNKLWQMDILEFYLNKLRVYLMLLLDDHSRFIVGHGLFTEANIDGAIGVVRRAVALHGKPESLLTDRGVQFYSWRVLNRFEKLLELLGIEHILARAHHPQTLGKVEAVNKRIQNEFLRRRTCQRLSELESGVAEWVHHYNHSRTHQGLRDPELGSVLVPADRYFGRVEEVLAKVRARLAGKETGAADYVEAAGTELQALEVFKILEDKDGLAFWLCGRRYLLQAAG